MFVDKHNMQKNRINNEENIVRSKYVRNKRFKIYDKLIYLDIVCFQYTNTANVSYYTHV